VPALNTSQWTSKGPISAIQSVVPAVSGALLLKPNSTQTLSIMSHGIQPNLSTPWTDLHLHSHHPAKQSWLLLAATFASAQDVRS
jgi:hypothetical protein